MCPPPEAVQEKVTPAVVDEPFSVTEVTTQVKVISAPALAFVGVLFSVTTATSVAVQPFAGLVTVKVYVPAESTTGVAVLAPDTMCPPAEAVHEKVTPVVVEEPFSVTEVTTQVST